MGCQIVWFLDHQFLYQFSLVVSENDGSQDEELFEDNVASNEKLVDAPKEEVVDAQNDEVMDAPNDEVMDAPNEEVVGEQNAVLGETPIFFLA